MCPASRNKKAFTFAEVLLCVYILAVALLGLMVTMVYCLQSQQASQRRVLATRAAEDRLLELTAAMHSAPEEFRADHRHPRVRTDEFEYAVAESEPAPDLKQLAVSVYFTDAGVAHDVTISELVYNSAR